ncbi:MAG: hypothetical protein WDN04_24425 [Rhodospirillales bacterium]
MHAVWPDTFVTEDSITQCIKEIRRTLGNGAQPLLRTLTRRGYLLAVPVSRLDTAAAAAVPVSGDRCRIAAGALGAAHGPSRGDPVAVREHWRRSGAGLLRERADHRSGDRT